MEIGLSSAAEQTHSISDIEDKMKGLEECGAPELNIVHRCNVQLEVASLWSGFKLFCAAYSAHTNGSAAVDSEARHAMDNKTLKNAAVFIDMSAQSKLHGHCFFAGEATESIDAAFIFRADDRCERLSASVQRKEALCQAVMGGERLLTYATGSSGHPESRQTGNWFFSCPLLTTVGWRSALEKNRLTYYYVVTPMSVMENT